MRTFTHLPAHEHTTTEQLRTVSVMRVTHAHSLKAPKMGHTSCDFDRNHPEELPWGWRLSTTYPFKKLSLSVSLGCYGQRGGRPGRQRTDSDRALDSVLKAMGTQWFFVKELSNMAKSKNKRSGDERTGFKNDSFTMHFNPSVPQTPYFSSWKVFLHEWFLNFSGNKITWVTCKNCWFWGPHLCNVQ